MTLLWQRHYMLPSRVTSVNTSFGRASLGLLVMCVIKVRKDIQGYKVSSL